MEKPGNTNIERPPSTVLGILGRLGPGLIIAGSIVGSGELIATTKTGAQAGFWLLWLIIIGCVIKVFVQVEFGRYAISSGKPTMTALDEVPGPRLKVNWLVWYWLVMFICSLAQLGGIAGGVGQSMATSFPITGDFCRLLDEQNEWDARATEILDDLPEDEARPLVSRDRKVREAAGKEMWSRLEAQLGPRPGRSTWDDIYWASLITLVTIVLLVVGRYALVQNVSTVLVATFTAITVFCVFAVQQTDYAFSWSELGRGFEFRLPSWEVVTESRLALVKALVKEKPISPLVTALAAFGIIGVGATVLHRKGLDPEGSQMIHALSQPYIHVFGDWALWLFLFGAFAVLYSTFFVAIAGHTRVSADAAAVYGLAKRTEKARVRWIKALSVLFPLIALLFCIVIRHPVKLILISGVMQAIMLPMLAAATLYFRYRRCDRRIMPGKLWDVMLWLSALGLLITGGTIVAMKILPALGM